MYACLAHYEKVKSNEFQEYDFNKEYHNKIMYLFTTLRRTDELFVCWSLMEKTGWKVNLELSILNNKRDLRWVSLYIMKLESLKTCFKRANLWLITIQCISPSKLVVFLDKVGIYTCDLNSYGYGYAR